MPDDIVGMIDVAAMLEVRPRTVFTWNFRGRLPEPDYIVSGAAAWWRSRIVAWALETDRWPS